LVIRFDLYRTMVQYVQSRGRARQNNSKFLHMAEAGNSEHAQLIHEVRFQESAMRHFCEALPEDRRLDSKEETLEAMMAKEKALPVYVEKSTGSKLTYGNARGRLANFVSAVPTDSDEPQHPTYVVSARGGKFVAEVILPEGAPIRCALSLTHNQKTIAKASAAFQACLELRKQGFLNEYLLPTYVKKLPAMRNAHLAVGMKKTSGYDRKLKPTLWEQTRGTIPEKLYLTVIDFPGGLGRPHRPIAMLTRTLMPNFPSFPVYLDDGSPTDVASRSMKEPMHVTSDMLAMLAAFTWRVLKDIFGKEYEDEPAQLSYFLAPVNTEVKSDDARPSSCLDWSLLNEVMQNDEYQWSQDMPHDMLANRFLIDKWEGGRRWYTKSANVSMSATDPVPADSPKPHSSAVKSKIMMESILSYSNSMFKASRERNKDVWDMQQPVLEAETLLLRRNMLAPPDPEQMAKASRRAYICPQPLRISILPSSVVASFFVWPSIIWRFESNLIALEAAELVGVVCDPAVALAAVTKDSENSGDHEAEERINFQHGMGENYERLEFMGDCFLKTATTISTFVQNPNDNEFEFHVKRMLMLCNKNLFEVAKELRLYEYIRTLAFDRRHWYPEGLTQIKGKGAKETEAVARAREKAGKHQLGEKTIADVCEAMMGAAFLTHDQPGNWHPDQWENAIRAVTKLVKSEDHTMLKWSDYIDAYNKPAYQTADTTASQKDMAEQIEQKHPYHFAYPRLLRSAFMHPSQPFTWEKIPSYQRLEFLGDALLDMTSISFIFYKFPTKDPQWLTEHKMAMIGNRALGMIAVTMNLHKHMRHNHTTVEHQIRDYATELLAAREAAQGAKDYWLNVSEPPKCLGDIVEAFVGAIFIDSNFDYNEVQRFFDMHIAPHFEDMALYDTYAKNHPCTLLQNLLTHTYGCHDHRAFHQEVMSAKVLNSNITRSAYMVHQSIVAHDKGKSYRYSQVRAAKIALGNLQGMALTEFRQRYGCDCSGQGKKGVVVPVSQEDVVMTDAPGVGDVVPRLTGLGT
jgi:endoribonuclease Dicer